MQLEESFQSVDLIMTSCKFTPQAVFFIISLSRELVKASKRHGGMQGVINVEKGRKQCFPLFPC